MNVVPSKFCYFLNGWVLRFTGGLIYRANSVFPVEYLGTKTQIEKDIDIVERAYKQFGLPAIFTMHEYFKPENLDEILKRRGYNEDSHTNALIAEISEVKRKQINYTYDYELYDFRPKDFSNLLARYTNKNEEQQEIINQISKRIFVSQKCFVLAKNKGKPVGTLMGVLNPEGYLYISDLLVDPNHRRNQIGNSMILTLIDNWALKRNAKYIWLQVEIDNHQAAKLYESLGMTKAYYYYYLKSE